MGGIGKEQKAGTTIRVLDDPFEWALRDAAEEPGEGEVRSQIGDVDGTSARAGLGYETVSGYVGSGIELLGASDDAGDSAGLLTGLGGGSGSGDGSGGMVVSGGALASEDGSWARWGYNNGGCWWQRRAVPSPRDCRRPFLDIAVVIASIAGDPLPIGDSSC